MPRGVMRDHLLNAAACEDASPILRTRFDVPEENLTRGQIGTVVEHLESEGDVAELVEFTDTDGYAYAIATLFVLNSYCRKCCTRDIYKAPNSLM